MKLRELEIGLVRYLLNGITDNGGWGNEPGPKKEPNPLNTAEVLCGLMSVRHHLRPGALTNACDDLVTRAIQYLHDTHLRSGGWATGSAYLKKDLQAKGNIVSTAWAIWALLERKQRYAISVQESEAILSALQRTHAFVLLRRGELWPYSPDLGTVEPMASAYGLFAVALLLFAEREFDKWDNRGELLLCLQEGLDRFEQDYLTKNGILSRKHDMNRMVVLLLCLVLSLLLECPGVANIETKLRGLRRRLWDCVVGYSPKDLTDHIVEKQAVVEPGKQPRDFIHYTPVWGILAAMNSPDGMKFDHFWVLWDRIIGNVDEKFDGASYAPRDKRYTWTTALTLMALGTVTDNIDFSTFAVPRPLKGTIQKVDPRKVFVVHGRNHRARMAMFEFIRALGLTPIEWDEAIRLTRTSSPFVGQVLDKAFERAQAVIIVMTGDDEARLREQFWAEPEAEHEKTLTPQARPNVIFEAGMALGRNPDRTIIVQIGECRPFSDIGGRHVVHFAGTSQDRQGLASRLEAAGCPVQRGGKDWLGSGDFEVL